MNDIYTHGHTASVVDAHATRTIANSAAYLAPHLVAGRSLLDVGCGPGTITVEFAERLGTGAVVGVDISPRVISDARARAGDTDVEFAVMDGYDLPADDDSFDIVHAHQVLQHVSDPVSMLREMRRVARPGGLVAVRDADYAAMHWSPESETLDRWLELYRSVARRNDAEPDAGRHLRSWARAAGFEHIDAGVSTWLFATPEQTGWWGGSWSRRVVESAMAEQAIAAGLATPDELNELSAGWAQWAADDDAWFVVVHGELVCHV